MNPVSAWHRWLVRLCQPQPAHLRLGRWGERKAERYLNAHTSLRILGRRVRVGPHDEIDLLAREGQVLVVIEVKTRAREGDRPIRDAVDQDKRYALSRAAVRYARDLTPRPDAIRFDIVEVEGTPETGAPRITHHPGAFGLPPGFRY